MNTIHGHNTQVNTATQPHKSQNKVNNTSSINFGSVFEVVKRSLDGIMVVAENNKASDAEIRKDKLEIEKKRSFSTDYEEANEILDKIAKIMEKHKQS